MTSVATINGLAIVGALFMLSGLAILGAALLGKTTLADYTHSKFMSAGKLHVAALFGLPLFGLGLFLQAAGNMAPTSIGAGLTALLLALAFTLIVFLMADETIADMLAQRATSTTLPAEAPAPAAAKPDIIEVAAPVSATQPGLALAS